MSEIKKSVKGKNKERKTEENCSICLKNITEKEMCELGCNHNFHIECIHMWCIEKDFHNYEVNCPLCREVIDIDIVIENMKYCDEIDDKQSLIKVKRMIDGTKLERKQQRYIYYLEFKLNEMKDKLQDILDD